MTLLYWLRLRRRRQRGFIEPSASAAAALAAAQGSPDHRATALLRSQCTEAQLRTLSDCYIEVRGSHGGRYCIHWNPLGRIDIYSTRSRFRSRAKHTHLICCHLRFWKWQDEGTPLADQIMAYKLGFETTEHRIRLRAQRTRLSDSNRPVH